MAPIWRRLGFERCEVVSLVVPPLSAIDPARLFARLQRNLSARGSGSRAPLRIFDLFCAGYFAGVAPGRGG